ncbi:MAG: DoxX family protein [Nanoarchaeota archaeon]|nr:DoxX family protein [Nanoarchaeota archaeon]
MKLSKRSTQILRYTLGAVFLYFGLRQIINPDMWTGFVPNFLTGATITANNWVIMNGILEITLSIFLILGLYTRFASLILSLHLLLIALPMIEDPSGVRDFGLTVATFIVFLNSPDRTCLDWKFRKK